MLLSAPGVLFNIINSEQQDNLTYLYDLNATCRKFKKMYYSRILIILVKFTG